MKRLGEEENWWIYTVLKSKEKFVKENSFTILIEFNSVPIWNKN